MPSEQHGSRPNQEIQGSVMIDDVIRRLKCVAEDGPMPQADLDGLALDAAAAICRLRAERDALLGSLLFHDEEKDPLFTEDRRWLFLARNLGDAIFYPTREAAVAAIHAVAGLEPRAGKPGDSPDSPD